MMIMIVMIIMKKFKNQHTIYVSICIYFAAHFKVSFIVENNPKAFGW